jgi:hypothetical protein
MTAFAGELPSFAVCTADGEFCDALVAHVSWIAVALADLLPRPAPAFFQLVKQMQWPEQWLAALHFIYMTNDLVLFTT